MSGSPESAAPRLSTGIHSGFLFVYKFRDQHVSHVDAVEQQLLLYLKNHRYLRLVCACNSKYASHTGVQLQNFLCLVDACNCCTAFWPWGNQLHVCPFFSFAFLGAVFQIESRLSSPISGWTPHSDLLPRLCLVLTGACITGSAKQL